MLPDSVILDKSHLFPSWNMSLHGRSEGLVYMILKVFLPAQITHWRALLKLLFSTKFLLVFQVFSSMSSPRWLMLQSLYPLSEWGSRRWGAGGDQTQAFSLRRKVALDAGSGRSADYGWETPDWKICMAPSALTICVSVYVSDTVGLNYSPSH